MKLARPVMGNTPGAQTEFKNPITSESQIEASLPDKLGDCEAKLMAISQGALVGGRYPSNQALRWAQPSRNVRARQVWQKLLALGGGRGELWMLTARLVVAGFASWKMVLKEPWP